MKIALAICLAAAVVVAVALFDRHESPNGPTREFTATPSEAKFLKETEILVLNENESSVVTVTSRAASVIKKFIADSSHAGPVHLRVRVVPGGCMGFLHKLDLDSKVFPDDSLSESAGVRVVMLKRQVEMLRGAEVDYGKFDGEQGFKIENPNFKGELAKKWLASLEREKDLR